MVLKRSKRCVNSGNTLRASPKLLRYAKESAIVKTCYNCEDSQSKVDKLDSQSVIYSLNKKGRWDLVDEIKDNILYDKHKDEKFAISLVERHMLLTKINCTSYCTSKGPNKCVEPKNTYFDSSSVIQKIDANGRVIQRRSTKPRRRRRFQDVEVEFVPAIPEVRYEVYQPCPVTSSITHNKKKLYGDSTSAFQRNSGSRSKARNTHRDWKQLEDDYYADDYLDYEDNTDEYTDDENNGSQVTDTSILAEILENALETSEKMNILADNKSHVELADIVHLTAAVKNTQPCGVSFSPSFDTKGKVFFMQEEYTPAHKFQRQKSENHAEVNNQDLTIGAYLESNLMSQVINIASEGMKPENLHETYGARYSEGLTIPRRFMIDISSDVKGHLRQHKMLPPNGAKMYASFLLNEDDSASNGLQSVRVCVKNDIPMEMVAIETLNEFFSYTIKEVIDAILSFMLILPWTDFPINTPTYHPTGKKPINFDLLNSACGWTTGAHIPEEVYASVVNKEHSEEPLDYCVPVSTEECCSVCFCTIISSATATALTSCLHWFCNDCWQKHLVARIKQGNLKLLCPEPGCKSMVDVTTLFYFVPVIMAMQHIQLVGDLELKKRTEWKWCPNPKCGRLLKNESAAAANSPVNLSCDCGKIVCFSCLKEAHWPSSCSQAESYFERLLKNADDTLIEGLLNAVDNAYVAKVKECPHCGVPMEKNGGCPFMACVCGKAFCWLCLKPWDSHGYGGCNTTRVGRQRHEIEEERTIADYLKHTKSRYYKLSLEHRKSRHPKWTSKMHRMAKELAKSVKISKINIITEEKKQLEAKDTLSCLSELINVEDVTSTSTENKSRYLVSAFEEEMKLLHNSRQELNNFLLYVVNFNAQIHHIAEYTAAFLLQDTERGHKHLHPYLGRLDFISASIEQILLSGKKQDMKRVVPRLEKFVFFGTACVREMAAQLKHVQ